MRWIHELFRRLDERRTQLAGSLIFRVISEIHATGVGVLLVEQSRVQALSLPTRVLSTT